MKNRPHANCPWCKQLNAECPACARMFDTNEKPIRIRPIDIKDILPKKMYKCKMCEGKGTLDHNSKWLVPNENECWLCNGKGEI